MSTKSMMSGDDTAEEDAEEDRRLEKLIFGVPQSENDTELDAIASALNHRLMLLSSVHEKHRQASDELVDSIYMKAAKGTKSRTYLPKFETKLAEKTKDTKGDGTIRSIDDGIFDSQRLVFLTKPSTESAKRLEARLDDTHGSVNFRDRGARSKTSRKDGVQIVEYQRSEAKRLVRLKLEKDLQANMESFMTRSVTESSLTFTAPEHLHEEPHWPISINWPAPDVFLIATVYIVTLTSF